MRDSQGRTGERTKSNVFKPVLFGFILAVALIAAGLLMMGLIVSKADVPDSVVWMMAVALTSLGGFVFGFYTAGKIRKKGLFVGLGCGLIICLLILFSGSVILNDGFCTQTVIKLVTVLVSSMLGGCLGVNKKQQRRRR